MGEMFRKISGTSRRNSTEGRDVSLHIRSRVLVLPLTALLIVLVVTAALRTQPAMAATTLRQAAEARGIKFGTALIATSNLSSNTAYINVAGSQFDAVTPGNEMKWGTVEPTQGQFNWSGADTIVSFAQAHNQVVRGHNLVWHSQLPNWVNSTNFPSAQSVINVMTQHITTEATRFKGKLIAWDVVNEPFNEDGSFRSDIFSQATPGANGQPGSGYIATALRTARAADPNPKLYLNDFNIEGVNAKSNAMLSLVMSLKQQGVPIDGVGLESHFILGGVPSSLQQNIQRFVNAGVNVWITELDDRINLPASGANLAQQATDYANVIRACLGVTGCVGVTVWGFTDLDSWVPQAFPGQGAADIYDGSIQPKPSFNSSLTALGGSNSPSPSPSASTPPTPTPTSGSLSATPVVASSGPFFTEEDLKLTSQGLTSLTVTIVVQRTTGVSFSSMFNTAGGQIQQSNSSTASAITYTFTLASGQRLGSGTFTFAAQMGGNGTVHPTSGDTFTVTSSAGSRSGHF
jgi:endo-1,4-beta-xylanase